MVGMSGYLDAALAETTAIIEEKRATLRELTDEIELLETERKGLELAIRRRLGRPAVEPTSPTTPAPVAWTKITRLDAVERVLAQTDRPMSPSEIAARLSALGRQGDTGNYVAAALSHLKRKGLVRKERRGEWIITPPPDTNGQGRLKEVVAKE